MFSNSSQSLGNQGASISHVNRTLCIYFLTSEHAWLKKTAASLTCNMVSNTTLSFSNIVGPLEEVSFYDHPLVYIAPSVFGHAHVSSLS